MQSFRYTFDNKNKVTSLKIQFIGTRKNNTVIENEFDQKIRSCFENLSSNTTLSNIVSWIRTIFNKYCEESLEIEFSTPLTNSSVLFENGILLKYNATTIFKKRGSNPRKLFTKYEKNKGIDFSIADFDDMISKEHFIEENMGIISESVKEIDSLSKCKAITLDDSSKIVCQIYKYFYNENLDFTKKDIYVKVHAMLVILGEFGITIDEFNNFNIANYYQVPIDINLLYTLNNLVSVGEVKFIGNPISLNERVVEISTITGNLIKEHCKNEKEMLDILTKLSMMIHIGRYNLENETANNVAKYLNYSIDDINKGIELVKKINKNYKNRKADE